MGRGIPADHHLVPRLLAKTHRRTAEFGLLRFSDELSKLGIAAQPRALGHQLGLGQFVSDLPVEVERGTSSSTSSCRPG